MVNTFTQQDIGTQKVLFGKQYRIVGTCHACERILPICARGMCGGCYVSQYWEQKYPVRHCARCWKWRPINPKNHVCRSCCNIISSGKMRKRRMGAFKAKEPGKYEQKAMALRNYLFSYPQPWPEMPDKDRYVLVARAFGDTFPEIAEVLGTARQRIQKREAHGLHILKQHEERNNS